MIVKFKDLKNSNLVVDAIYEGGNKGGAGDDPLSKLFPKLGNSGGFRKALRNDKSKKLAYVILYTSMSELEWPDYLDVETGIFRYYGDNRKAGNNLLDTKFGGNKLLEDVFNKLNCEHNYKDIPPFFVFKKNGKGRDVTFLGLAVPGNPAISADKDLVAFWRTIDNHRFQNYEAYFTILNTQNEEISYKWLDALLNDNENSIKYAPSAWKDFVEKGKNGIKALKAPRTIKLPNKYAQLQCSEDGKKCVDEIRMYFKNNPSKFEACAVKIVEMMDINFKDFDLTRPWRDGGRDAIGKYVISSGNVNANYPLTIDCALEAKCYSEGTGVNVKNMSRLISRIKYRQFGIIVTTSYVSNQAYKEVVEDGHPILILTCSDIAYILARNMIDSKSIKNWLIELDRDAYGKN